MTIQELIDLLETGWDPEERKTSKIFFSYDTGKRLEDTSINECVLFEPTKKYLVPTLHNDGALSFGMDMAGDCHVDIVIPEGHYDIDVTVKR